MPEGKTLGRLERVSLREVWESEAGNFTPWLATRENLALLGDTIGLELECEGVEKEVGPFRADILCRDTASQSLVLIENQLERTDHTHLGQLLTYAAGLDTVTIVWIAQRFTDEHRAALDWLNEVTNSSINLFGLEIELWRIGDSPVAPKFNIIAQPNDWLKAATEERAGLTEIGKLRLEFWTIFREAALKRSPNFKMSAPRAGNSIQVPLGRTGIRIFAVANAWSSESETSAQHELRAELHLDGLSADVRFLKLQADRAAIETAMGEALIWQRPDDSGHRRIYVRRGVDLESRDNWTEYHDWLFKKVEALHRVFAPRVPAIFSVQDPSQA